MSAENKSKENEAAQQFAGLSIGGKGKGPEQRPQHPPRPVQAPPEEEEDESEEEDENDPFADRNALATPKVEKSEPSW